MVKMTLETDAARFDLSHKVQLRACSVTLNLLILRSK